MLKLYPLFFTYCHVINRTSTKHRINRKVNKKKKKKWEGELRSHTRHTRVSLSLSLTIVPRNNRPSLGFGTKNPRVRGVFRPC